jgi:putative membrane protein
MIYLWLKAFHIIFVVSWMAALLVYPRYKLHQVKAAPGEPLFDTMQTASAQLKRIILTPSMLAVWILGIAMIVVNPGIAAGKWIWVKLILVLAMTALHGMFVGIGKKVDRAGAEVSVSRLRLLNELPFVLLIVIVLLVVLKPF